jgi:hypothetical protein
LYWISSRIALCWSLIEAFGQGCTENFWLSGGRYNGICLMVQKLVNIIKQMDPRDPFRIEMTDMLLDKL